MVPTILQPNAALKGLREVTEQFWAADYLRRASKTAAFIRRSSTRDFHLFQFFANKPIGSCILVGGGTWKHQNISKSLAGLSLRSDWFWLKGQLAFILAPRQETLDINTDATILYPDNKFSSCVRPLQIPDIGEFIPKILVVHAFLWHTVNYSKPKPLCKSISIQVAVGIKGTFYLPCPVILGLMSVPAAQASVALITKFLFKSIVCRELIKNAMQFVWDDSICCERGEK